MLISSDMYLGSAGRDPTLAFGSAPVAVIRTVPGTGPSPARDQSPHPGPMLRRGHDPLRTFGGPDVTTTGQLGDRRRSMFVICAGAPEAGLS